jgi:hypothetical protein
MLRNQKILRRPDGTRVRISVSFHLDWSRSQPHWAVLVDRCEKGKRTWKALRGVHDLVFPDASKQDIEGVRETVREELLALVSVEELETVMLETWEMLRPIGK